MNELFSSADLRTLVPALREVQLVWLLVQDRDFLERGKAYLGADPKAWYPANLALLAIGLHVLNKGLTTADLYAMPVQVKHQASAYYESWSRLQTPPKNLAEAGLLALAISEIHKREGNWLKVQNLIMHAIQAGECHVVENWSPILACLMGMVEDGRDLLKLLLAQGITSPISELVGAAIFSRPSSLSETANVVIQLMGNLSKGQQITWLQRLRYEGRRELVALIAGEMLDDEVESTSSERHDINQTEIHKTVSAKIVDESDLEVCLLKVFELERKAILSFLGGQAGRAKNYLQAARNLNSYTLAGLELQLLDSGYRPDLTLERQELMRGLQASFRLRGELAYNSVACSVLMPNLLECCGDFWSGQKSGDVKSEISGIAEPLLRLRQAILIADSGNQELAQDIARTSARQWKEIVLRKPDHFTPVFVFDWNPIDFYEIFQKLGLTNEAEEFLAACLMIRPNDPVLLRAYQAILQQNKSWENAKAVTNSLLMIEPENTDWHRKMAEVLWGAKDYEGSLQERQSVMRLDANPGIEDWYSLALAAEKTGDCQLAIGACQEILRQNPNHGGANAMVGQSLADEGKTEEAVDYLSRATLSAPEQSKPWIALANLYEQQGDERRSFETLRAAVLAAPLSGEVKYALGQKYVSLGQFSDALPYMREARALIPDSQSLLLDLGRLLRSIGMNDESRQVLQEGCNSWMQSGEFCVEYGLTCLASSEKQEALHAFDKAVHLNPNKLDWIFLYAEAILDTPEGENQSSSSYYVKAIQQARKLLEDRLLEEHELPIRARYLLGELLLKMGEASLALDLFQVLLEDPEAENPDWRWQIQSGFGKAALALGQNEPALAVLREAAQEQPKNVELLKSLVRALRVNHLEKEAEETARYMMKLVPNSLGVLSWFANTMAEMGHSDEAVSALECALQIEPGNSANWLKLIEVHLRADDPQSARATLQKFLLYGAEDVDTLRKTAHVCIRLGDYKQAIDCLERAGAKPDAKDADDLVVLAILYQRIGDLEKGMDCFQQLEEVMPTDPILQVMKADVFIRTGRGQAAIAYLEKALEIWRQMQSQGAIEAPSVNWEILVELGLVKQRWIEKIASPSSAHWRYAGILFQAGEWQAVESQIDQAVTKASEDRQLRYAAAEGLVRLLRFEQALRIIEDTPEHSDLSDIEETGQSQVLDANTLCLQVELMIELGRLKDAWKLVEEGSKRFTNSARLAVLMARKLVYHGKQSDAEKQLNKIPELSTYQTHWMAKGLLDVGRYEEALGIYNALMGINTQEPDDYEFFDKWAVGAAGNPLTAFEFGRAMVICAEQTYWREGLKVQMHVPPPDCTNESHFLAMAKFLQFAHKVSSNEMVERWLIRGRMAFHPSAQTALELANQSPREEDIAALVMMLRRINRTGNAIHWAQKFPDEPAILAQMAMSMVKIDEKNGLLAMRKAVELRPGNPLILAGSALLAQQVAQSPQVTAEEGEDFQELALNSLKAACEIWPDEPMWHYWAAEIAAGLRKEVDLVAHLERAFVLRPHWFEAAYALGKAYLAHHQTALAVEVLERAVELAPGRGDVCYTLALANRSAGNRNEALLWAERSSSLDYQATAPLLLCGEVALELGKLSDAEKFAQAAVKRDSKDISVILFLSRVKEKRGDIGDAFKVLEDALGLKMASRTSNGENSLRDLQQKNLPLMVEHARLAKRVKGAKVALPMLDAVARQFPNEFLVLQQLAEVNFECGNHEEAEKIAIQGLRLQPGDIPLSLLMGRIMLQNGQLDLAVKYFIEVIQNKPGMVEAYLDLGSVYQQRREFRKALDIYRRAREAAPRDYRLYYEAANVLKEIKDYSSAEEMLKSASELAPNEVNIRKQLSALMALNLIRNSPAHKEYPEEVNSHL